MPKCWKQNRPGEVFEKLEDCYFSQRPERRSTTTDYRTPLRDAVNMLVGKKGMMYPDAYTMIHQRFAVSHIEQLSQTQMLEAIEYIHCLLLDENQPTIPDFFFYHHYQKWKSDRDAPCCQRRTSDDL